MAELTTSWLGMTLASPLVVGASPLTHDVEAVATAVANGAGAVVMHSLFEEQVIHEQLSSRHFLSSPDGSAEEAEPLPVSADTLVQGAEPYLRQLDRLRKRVTVPIVASLNGVTPGGWTDFARACEVHGADAIELNLYDVVTSAADSGRSVEDRQLAIVESVANTVALPLTVKISPYYTSVPSFVEQLSEAGADGVTLFNRFYQPDVDMDQLSVDRRLSFSTSRELPLRLHALAILSPETDLDLACTGGIHSGQDAAKALLCGAHVMQCVSALLEHGPAFIGRVLGELHTWLRTAGYASSNEARGVLTLAGARDAVAWERLNYIRILDGWQPRNARHGAT